MKSTLLYLIIFVFFSTPAFCQFPIWEWGKGANLNNTARGETEAVDSIGNNYVAGTFVGANVDFGNGILTNPTSNFNQGFICKYNAIGTLLWSKSFGGNHHDGSRKILTDSNGNVLLLGYFKSSVFTFDNITLNNSGNEDIFLAKFDANGNALWAKKIGGDLPDWENGMTIDSFGNIYITGGYTSTTLTIGSTTLTNNNPGNSVFFVAKFDPSGNAIWAKDGGGTSNDAGGSIAVDNNGNTYVTGVFSSPSFTIGLSSITNQSNTGINNDIFLMKLDNAGAVVWIKSYGTIDAEFVSDIKISTGNQLYLSGKYTAASINFGNFNLQNSDNSGSTSDLFIVKLDQQGNEIWAKTFGGIDSDSPQDLAIDFSGNCYLGGFSNSVSINFGNNNIINSNGDYDGFILKCDSLGTTDWAVNIGGTGSDYLIGLNVDLLENVYCTGNFSSTNLTFGNDNIQGLFFHSKLSNIITHANSKTLVSNRLMVYPSPSNGHFLVSAPFEMNKIEIIDAQGRLVDQRNIQAKNYALEITNSGLYFIKAIDDKTQFVSKIIIE